MPEPTSTTPMPSTLQAQGGGGASAGAGGVTIGRSLLLRALLQTIAVLLVVGTGLGLLLFGGDALLAETALPYYALGLGAACVAMLLTIWLHGRFAATPAPHGDPSVTRHGVSARLTGLLAAGMGVKMAVIVIGFVALKQFPLGEEPTKFSDIATFAVTFAGAALLCQIGTALTLARALRRRDAN
ncbi:MAG: hypothetical protein KAI24_03560 [Planctomycetes bacterium]|nr:hypothetical protein [Planctomycetota bacterium]